jgi:uncharacterized membrane protein
MQQHAERRFQIGEAVGTGWKKFWPNLVPMILFALIVWAVNGLIQLPQREGGNTVVVTLFAVIGFIVGQLIAIGWIKLALDIIDGNRPNFQAITDKFRVFLPYLVAAVLFSVMVTIGLFLLVVPGIILAIIFAFYGFHIVDTDEKHPIEALRRSAELTKGSRWQLFLFGLVLIGINILGLLVLIVGVLISSGISLLAIAYVYRKLSAAPVDTPTDDPTHTHSV